LNRIRNLDGVRGLAILLVVAGHVASNYPGLPGVTRQWLHSFANSGMGVRLFFALSGYLITELMLREQEARGAVRFGDFYLRRARRILPAFYVFLAIVGGAIWWLGSQPAPEPSAWLASATFVWNYSFLWTNHGGGDLWTLGHTWSLAVEAQFYLLWPFVLVRLGQSRALPLLLLLLALAPAVRVGTYLLFPAQRGLLGMMLHTGYDGIAAGCAAALLARRSPAVAFLRRHAATGCFLALLWIFVGGPVLQQLVRGFSIVGGFTLDAVSAAWLTACVHLAPPRWAGLIFGSGPLPPLGIISYSLYLWQQVFLSPNGPLKEGYVFFAVATPVAIACASYWLVERRFLRSTAGAANRSRPLVQPTTSVS
jgi:peptidoglycan/LPS O-acetylase OafA/YrhL